MCKSIIAASSAILLAAGAHAANEKGDFFILGAPGAMSCADFVAKKDTGATGSDFGNWLGGYVSALNRTTPGVYNLVENLSMEVFYTGVVELCASNPTMLVETVTYNLLLEAHKQHKTSTP